MVIRRRMAARVSPVAWRSSLANAKPPRRPPCLRTGAPGAIWSTGTIQHFSRGFRVQVSHSMVPNTRRCVRTPHPRHVRDRYGTNGKRLSVSQTLSPTAYCALVKIANDTRNESKCGRHMKHSAMANATRGEHIANARALSRPTKRRIAKSESLSSS